jgi:hypothetical protein
MYANLIYFIGIGCLLIGTFLTYYGSHLKSEEGTKTLETAISKKDTLIDNLNLQVTDLRKEQEKQLLLQEAPVVKILPDGIVKGTEGSFELSIENSGLSDVVDIEIYEDYFVALGLINKPIKLYRFGMFSIKPNTEIKYLPKNKAEKFRIEFKKTLDDMSQFYRDNSIKGQRMMIARIKINLVRQIDGKKFSHAKAFIIAGNGDTLVDYDTSREIKGDIIAYSFDDVKEILGITR